MKGNKKTILYLGLTITVMIISISLSIILRINRKPGEMQVTENIRQTESDIVEETDLQETENVSERTSELTEAVRETESREAIEMNLKNLESFLSDQQIQELKQEIVKVLPEATQNVKCLKFQKSSAENMDVVFYLQTDTGAILEGNYNFQFATFSVIKTDLKESDIRKMQEEEQRNNAEADKAAKEAAEARAREAAQKQAEKIKRKAEKKAVKNSDETEVKKEEEP
ncbi:hypothetical protein [uncultured Robinsoniella sp.]|uniref:hypothetical protein n=1 Tax=uncultured Robinsoniella sp. TaxID=904190 RepID=UPI00374E87F3